MKLIIINGPCGVGKSTLAARLHNEMPLSFLLDIDAQSKFISHYREYREERWEMYLAISSAIIDTCLKLGRDVIVEKMIYDPVVIDNFINIGKIYNADIREIIIWASKDVVMNRAEERGYRDESLLTREKCEDFWEKINSIKGSRTDAILIDADRDEDQVFKDLINSVK
ncbi:MAG: AAA family ATPase [Candidatus Uhrbacteria bacterium]|nr:AAA family ATPase [Candidatus Uhrbacteria bacterium]